MCEQGRDKRQQAHVCAWEIFTSFLPNLSEKSDTIGFSPTPAGSVPSQEPAWHPGTTLSPAPWGPGAPVQAAPPLPSTAAVLRAAVCHCKGHFPRLRGAVWCLTHDLGVSRY